MNTTMQGLSLSIGAVVPTLLLVSLGIVLKRRMHLEPAFWTGLEKLVYFVFFPILLAENTLHAELSLQQGAVMLMALGIMIVGIGFSWLGIAFNRAPAATRRSIFQCGFRFNTYVGIAVVNAAFGQAGVALFALITAMCVPLANLAAISALSAQSGTPIWKELARNPLVIGTLIGIVSNLLGVKLPAFAAQTFSLISHAAIVLGLIAVGAALHFESLGYYRRLGVYFLTLKLMLLPLLTLLALKFLLPPLSPMVNAVIMIFAALPTASTAFVLAMRLNGDGKTVALQITLGSVISMVTIPFWMHISQIFLDIPH